MTGSRTGKLAMQSTSRASVMSCSTVVAPKKTPRCGSVNPNETSCVVMASLLEVPFQDGLHHQKIVLARGQDQLRARKPKIGGAHHPHERQVTGKQFLEPRVGPDALLRV